MILGQGKSLFHDTAVCGFGLDVRAVKLSDQCLVEGFVNRVKDPLIRVADSCHKALVRLAVDIQGAGLTVLIGPPPAGSVERRRRFSHLGPFDDGMAVAPSSVDCGKQNIDLMLQNAAIPNSFGAQVCRPLYWISGISVILPLSK